VNALLFKSSFNGVLLLIKLYVAVINWFLGSCSVHLVELKGTGEFFAMKAMDKSVMLNRNKV